MRYFIVILLSLLTILQVGTVAASEYSQQLVAEGRALLFDSDNTIPDPTYSGLMAANDKFAQAVAADSGDELANVFYAFTRVPCQETHGMA